MKQIPGGVTAAKGFLASGVHCGVKKGKGDGNQPPMSKMPEVLAGKKDLALIVSQQPCVAAAVYTMNRVKAAPLYVTMEHLENGEAQGIVANSGNANACAPNSHEHAETMCQLAAQATGLKASDFVVASTGVIGQELNIDAIAKGMPAAAAALSKDGSDAAANAIMTTDTVKKELSVTCSVGGKTVTIGAIAKGSGMIHPNMGTMLCFVTTDCAITHEMLTDALHEIVPRTFNRVTVDGDTSTNDMCAVLANGMADNPLIEWKDDGYTVFYKSLHYVFEQLARGIAADGEGAGKLITCTVHHAREHVYNLFKRFFELLGAPVYEEQRRKHAEDTAENKRAERNAQRPDEHGQYAESFGSFQIIVRRVPVRAEKEIEHSDFGQRWYRRYEYEYYYSEYRHNGKGGAGKEYPLFRHSVV